MPKSKKFQPIVESVSKSQAKRLGHQKAQPTQQKELKPFAATKIKNNAKKKFNKFEHPSYMDKKDFIKSCEGFIALKKTQLEHISTTISYYISERANGLKALKQLNKVIEIEKNDDIIDSYLRLIDYYEKDVKIANAHIKNYRAHHGLELKSLTQTQKKLTEVK